MKSIVLKSFLYLSFFIQVGSCSNGEKSQSMTEPLMGMAYNPDSIHFEVCPPWFDSRDGHVPGKEWIFAKCSQPEGTYYVYSGLFKQWNDQSEVWVDSILEPDFGVVIRVQGQKVTDIGTPEIFYGKKSKLPLKTLQCLAEDAIKRYSSAFGGIAGLQRTVSMEKVAAENLPKILVEALRTGGISVPDKKE